MAIVLLPSILRSFRFVLMQTEVPKCRTKYGYLTYQYWAVFGSCHKFWGSTCLKVADLREC